MRWTAAYRAGPFFVQFSGPWNHETYLPAEQGAPRTHAWISGPHGHAKRACSARSSPSKRPQAP